MAKKITPEIIEEIKQLYAKIKTYSGVAKKLGISASTVSKYIKEATSVKTYSSYDGVQPFIPTKESLFSFSSLSKEEIKSYTDWLEEF